MVVSLVFVNGSHHWPVIKWFPSCSTSNPLFTWLGFIPMGSLDWIPWADSSIIIFCYFLISSRPFHTPYDICWDIDPPCILVAMIDYWAWIHLFIFGHGSFRFDVAPFCIFSDHNSFISYTYVGSAYIFMVMICTWTCMSQRSALANIYLSFRYLFSSLSILDSLLSP